MKTGLNKKERAAIQRDLIKRGLMRVEFDMRGKVESASVEPGDILIFSTELWLTHPQIDELRARIEQSFPSFKIVLLTSGLRLNVLRPNPPVAAEAPPP